MLQSDKVTTDLTVFCFQCSKGIVEEATLCSMFLAQPVGEA